MPSFSDSSFKALNEMRKHVSYTLAIETLVFIALCDDLRK